MVIKQEKVEAVVINIQPSTSNEIILVNDDLIVEKIDNHLADNEWLNARHIDAAFDFIEKSAVMRGYLNFTLSNVSKIDHSIRNDALIHQSFETDKIYAVNVNNVHWILLTNIDPILNADSADILNWKQTDQQEWFFYDSMNNESNCQATAQVLRLLYPHKTWEKINLVHVEPQNVTNDCGLFVFAYAQYLSLSKGPARFKFDLVDMREKLNFFAKFGYLEDFNAVELINKEKNVKGVIVRF